MLLRKCVSTALLLFLTGNAFAATEYLRFVGQIYDAEYLDESQGWSPSLGLSPNQSVYLDFRIDTNLNAAGHPDYSYQDNFYVRYLAGSLGGAGTTTYGRTSTFPEGKISQLFLPNYLSVGTIWRSPEYPFDDSISTWSVGDTLRLLGNGGYFSEYSIGSLQLTHRSNTVLPLHVPLPQAAWLFVSGLLVLVGIKKQK